jgi:L-2,4-diaminobutyrate decarboxylase
MGQGLVVPGSTVANLTALWAARDTAGVDTVITSAASHHSIAKAARILGLRLLQIPTDTRGRWEESVAAETVARAGERAAVVPTMGTTSTGAIDSLAWLSDVSGRVGWVHVDAAWAGPLGFTSFAHRLGTAFAEGLVDSVAVSAHKWMFQPKDSALAMFKPDLDLEPISATAGYLSTANLGIQGSRGADAVLALALTLAAYGVEELGTWIEWCLGLADRLTTAIAAADRFEVHEGSDAGVVVWRPTARPGHETMAAAIERAGVGVSLTRLDEDWWFRSVSANPFAEPEEIVDRLTGALA